MTRFLGNHRSAGIHSERYCGGGCEVYFSDGRGKFMANVIVIGILLVLVGVALVYIKKEKKRGAKCIGCPSAGCCSSNCNRRKHDSN